jgi:nitrite reductase/ring-hydroxylating ferredoxin subunit
MFIKSRIKAAILPTLLILFLALMTSCGGQSQRQADSVPLVPLEFFAQGESVIPWRAPLRIKDTQLQMLHFDASGNRALRSYDGLVFPVDLMIVNSKETQTAMVFLRRSPHGGCLLLWNSVDLRFDDPCFGSRFDLSGNYLSGPSPRALDQLPASIRDGMIWVTPEIIYGETHP